MAAIDWCGSNKFLGSADRSCFTKHSRLFEHRLCGHATTTNTTEQVTSTEIFSIPVHEFSITASKLVLESRRRITIIFSNRSQTNSYLQPKVQNYEVRPIVAEKKKRKQGILARPNPHLPTHTFPPASRGQIHHIFSSAANCTLQNTSTPHGSSGLRTQS